MVVMEEQGSEGAIAGGGGEGLALRSGSASQA